MTNKAQNIGLFSFLVGAIKHRLKNVVIPANKFVIPAKAGIHRFDAIDSRLRGSDGRWFGGLPNFTRIAPPVCVQWH